MKRNCIRIASVTAALFALPAAAQEPGFYAGISVGQSKFNNQCDGTPSGVTCDENTTTYKLFGGYQFNRNIAVEAGYTDRLGKLEISGFGQRADVTARAFEVLAVPALPLNESFSVYGKIGLYAASSDVSSSTGVSTSESNTGGTIGLGAAWHFNKNLAARVDWQRYGKVGGDTVGEADIDTFNIGLLYRF